jgi:hypothetical protein
MKKGREGENMVLLMRDSAKVTLSSAAAGLVLAASGMYVLSKM